ncbi:hypothetical protein [Kordiimonas sp. SCSIO 12610]|uniref:hypothetical protein n=1 Tax=Kordiimonas sp. SCSIO 12610 TaxID=2829597 RepID=UPI00210C455B|nr:hypothetical protein [Kordiimonas sp. SCSIO 12610]UTW54091.1 hypothetical protein KFF44_09620 [Kordiimonas sp. SCSIO 12610]
MQIDYTAEQAALQPKLASANINPTSFLATDYLNHFNEIVMLMEMVPDMPDIAEETYEWQPKSYQQHFADSGFTAKDLAIEAFEKAPDPIKTRFTKVCSDIDELVLKTIEALKLVNAPERGLSPQASDFIRSRIAEIQHLLMLLNQVIHGKLEDAVEDTTPTFEEASMAAMMEESGDEEGAQSQEDIDKLFD